MADEKDGGKLRRTYERARESVTEGVDKITGREFRRQFEEFTDAVTTSVLGIYRDGAVAKDRIEQAEKRVAEIEGVVRFLSEANEGCAVTLRRCWRHEAATAPKWPGSRSWRSWPRRSPLSLA